MASKLVVRGIAPYQGGLPLVQKIKYGGRWDFPGGKVEPGEDPETALLRELPEETGLTATGFTLIGSMRHLFMPNTIALFYLCHEVSGDLQNLEPDQHRQVARRDFGEVCGLIGRNMPPLLAAAMGCAEQSSQLIVDAAAPRLTLGAGLVA